MVPSSTSRGVRPTVWVSSCVTRGEVIAKGTLGTGGILMKWTAEIVSEPTRNHELCVDLFEDDIHRARLQRNERRELELVCYRGQFAIPAEWLADVVERFAQDSSHKAPSEDS